MKKQVIRRGLLGIPLGITISYLITIVISLGWGQGYYSPCVPELVEAAGSEMNAVILQTILSGIVGAAFAASSVIWEMEDWSIAKQTGLYFLITTFVMMPIAYFTNWMEHSVTGFLIYFGIFLLIFVVVWLIQYLSWKHEIKEINTKLD